MNAGELSRGHRAFVLLFCGAAALYLAILFTSQRHVDGDEAVVGIMAKHVVERGARPVFFYGQPYGGGAAIEAYLAALPMAIFGVSPVPLKLVALALGLAALALTYGFCLCYLGRRTALLAALLLATAGPLVEWHTKVRGGYAALPLLGVGLLWLFVRVAGARHKVTYAAFALGLLAGVAIYNQALILPSLLVLALASLFLRGAFFRPVVLGLGGSGVLLGLLPLIAFNLTHDNLHLRNLLATAGGGGGAAEALWALVSHQLPAFFSPRNVDGYAESVPLAAWAAYLLWLGLTACLLWSRRGRWRGWLRALGDGNRARHLSHADLAAALPLAMVLGHLLISALTGRLQSSPRYLLPLFPGVAITTAVALDWLIGQQRPTVRRLGQALAAAVILLGLASHLAYLGPSRVNDDVVVQGNRLVNRMTSGAAIPRVAATLKANGTFHVYAPYFIKWRLLFESNEQIIASAKQLVPGYTPPRFPEYDQEVAKASRRGYVFHKEDVQLEMVLASPIAGKLDRTDIEEFVVLTPKQ